MGLEYFNQPLIFSAVGFQALQLVTAGAEGAGRRVAQGGDVLGRLQAGIDQLFGQRTDDAVTAGVHLADLVRVLTGCFDYAGCGGVDDGGNAA